MDSSDCTDKQRQPQRRVDEGQRLASEVVWVCVWTLGCLVQDRVDNFITNTKDIPMELATEGVIKLSRTEISKLTGMKEAVEEME